MMDIRNRRESLPSCRGEPYPSCGVWLGLFVVCLVCFLINSFCLSTCSVSLICHGRGWFVIAYILYWLFGRTRDSRRRWWWCWWCWIRTRERESSCSSVWWHFKYMCNRSSRRTRALFIQPISELSLEFVHDSLSTTSPFMRLNNMLPETFTGSTGHKHTPWPRYCLSFPNFLVVSSSASFGIHPCIAYKPAYNGCLLIHTSLQLNRRVSTTHGNMIWHTSTRVIQKMTFGAMRVWKHITAA